MPSIIAAAAIERPLSCVAGGCCTVRAAWSVGQPAQPLPNAVLAPAGGADRRPGRVAALEAVGDLGGDEGGICSVVHSKLLVWV